MYLNSLILNKLTDKKKTILLKVCAIIATFIITIIIPLIVYLQALDMNYGTDVDASSYLNRLERNTIQIIIIGIIITVFLLISYLLKPFSVYKLTISIAIKILIIISIIVASSSEIFEIRVENLYLKVDFSVLNLFILPVPVLFITRTILRYIYKRKELVCTLIILETILIKNSNSKSKIRKSVIKDKDINKKLKKYLFKNFDEIIHNLESRSYYPFIVRVANGFRVTKAGQDFLGRYGNEILAKDDQIGYLEVWTESDLEKLARKRAKKNKKIFNVW